jgi:hypothetical protein
MNTSYSSLYFLLFATLAYAGDNNTVDESGPFIPEKVLFIISPGTMDGGWKLEKKPPLGYHYFKGNRWSTPYKSEIQNMKKRYDPFGIAKVIRVNLPIRDMDMGQTNCQNFYFNTVLDYCRKDEYKNIVLAGSSQGSRAALYSLGCVASSIYNKKIKGVLIEGSVTSINAAILHTAKNIKGGKFLLNYIPGCYYLLPYVAKLFGYFRLPGFRKYTLCDSNMLDLARDAVATYSSNHIPIFIVHDKNDWASPIENSRALYYALKKRHSNTFYIETDNKDLFDITKDHSILHTDLLQNDTNAIKLFVDIGSGRINLDSIKDCQPDHKNSKFKKAYEEIKKIDLLFSSHLDRWIIYAYIITFSILICGCIYLYKTWPRFI